MALGESPRCPFSGAAISGAHDPAQAEKSPAEGKAGNTAPAAPPAEGAGSAAAAAADDRSFIERKVSNIFDGFTPFTLLKSYAPVELIVGWGVLLAALLATVLPASVLFALAAVLILPPYLLPMLSGPDPKAPLVRKGIFTAKPEGEFCVFLLGARSNTPGGVFNRQFGFVGKHFRGIMRELERLPASAGYLGGEFYTTANLFRGSHVLCITYWRSFDDMVKYTYDSKLGHQEAVRERVSFFPDPVGMADCGIWHEAYRVKPGCYETVYLNCPPLHMGAAADVVEAKGPLRHLEGRVQATLGEGEDEKAT